MKEHILRDMVNNLHNIAYEFHGHQCLRQLILGCVTEHLQRDADWQESHCTVVTAKGKPCKALAHKERLCFMHFWSKGKPGS